MNKQDLIKDLTILQNRHQKLLGAIEYIIGKIQELEKIEAEEQLKRAETKKPEEPERLE